MRQIKNPSGQDGTLEKAVNEIGVVR